MMNIYTRFPDIYPWELTEIRTSIYFTYIYLHIIFFPFNFFSCYCYSFEFSCVKAKKILEFIQPIFTPYIALTDRHADRLTLSLSLSFSLSLSLSHTHTHTHTHTYIYIYIYIYIYGSSYTFDAIKIDFLWWLLVVWLLTY